MAKAKADQAANAAGVSIALYLEALIMRDTVDNRGCPVWADDEWPSLNLAQEELLSAKSA